MPVPDSKVAFVTGCNGISGNAIVEHLIRLPKEEWSIIIVSSRSPLKHYWQDPRVEFVALDFLEPVDTIISKMPPACKRVTHAYYTSYVHTDDFSKLREANVPLFEHFLTAIDSVAGENLQRICLQTGGKVRMIPQISKLNSSVIYSIMAITWGLPSPPRPRTGLAMTIRARTFTSRRKTSCSRYRRGGSGLTISSVPTASSASHPEVSSFSSQLQTMNN